MKKLIAIALTATMLFTLSTPTFAAGVGEKEDVLVFNAGFHCGTYGGNGRVWVDNYEDDNWEEFGYLGDGVWQLLRDDYVCPDCGNNEWVSFSNMSGVPDGKNIQLEHAGLLMLARTGIVIDQEVMVTTANEKTIEKWQGEKTPYQTITQYVSPAFSSVTATTDAQLKTVKRAKNGQPEKKGNEGVIVANSNHFTYAKLAYADLSKGVELTLVVGNGLDFVGKATAKIENGKLALSFGDNLYKCGFGAVAFTKILEPKNGNIHSEAVFKHNNQAIINLPPADKDGFIYLYVHISDLQYILKSVESDIEWKVTKEPVKIWEKTVTKNVGPKQVFIDVEVFDSEGDLIDESEYFGIAPGDYTVVFHDPYLDNPVEKVAAVTYGKVTTVSYKADYTVPGKKTTKKINLPFIEKDLVITKKIVTGK